MAAGLTDLKRRWNFSMTTVVFIFDGHRNREARSETRKTNQEHEKEATE